MGQNDSTGVTNVARPGATICNRTILTYTPVQVYVTARVAAPVPLAIVNVAYVVQEPYESKHALLVTGSRQQAQIGFIYSSEPAFDAIFQLFLAANEPRFDEC
jgi:hypothetical protein